MPKIFILKLAILICFCSGVVYAAGHGGSGVYKAQKREYTYSYKREGRQVAVVWSPSLPENGTIVVDAVRHTIKAVYGKNSLISPGFETVYVQGIGLMKFRARGRYILVTIMRDKSNGKVFGWSMFESDK